MTTTMAENANATTMLSTTPATVATTGTTDHGSLFFITRNPNTNSNYNTAIGFNVIASLPPSLHPFSPLLPSVGLKEEEMGKEEVNMESISGGSELNIEGPNNELDTLSGGSGGSGGGGHLLLPLQPPQRPPKKKKRYHRHTAHQIQQMEALLRECAHPDDKQRMKLSQELGLKPRQGKFWFQNRRTQMKVLSDPPDSTEIR